MYNNIILVGGAHGVGKSTVCKLLCEKLSIEYLSASDVLKWKQLKQDYTDKNVDDISYTQSKLINNLTKIVSPSKYYILDGHFCLFNAIGDVAKIPLDTFEKIKPISIYVVVGDINSIIERLDNRDGKLYDINKLLLLQNEEKLYGEFVSKYFQIPYLLISSNNFEALEENILSIKANKTST